VFDAYDIDYALCGGLAVAIYGYSRFTKDIDLIIKPEDLHSAKEHLGEIGYIYLRESFPLNEMMGHFRKSLEYPNPWMTVFLFSICY
jgi:hypothetical protein